MNIRLQEPPLSSRRRKELLQGSVLLEVILALVLFVAAAAVVTSAVNASLDSVDRQRLTSHAVNLASSVLAELQIGARSAALVGPEEFAAPFEGWTWELELQPMESDAGETTPLTRVEVVIRHKEPAMVYRLAQVIRFGKTASVQPVPANDRPL
jgi:type II secretory pathway pseudopilin PulG